MEEKEKRYQYPHEFCDKFIDPIRQMSVNDPESVSIEVTTRCQLNCIYCVRDIEHPKDLSLSNLQEMVSHLKGVKKLTICGIGESFCYPYIYEAMEVLRNYQISIISNGAVKIDFERLHKFGNVKLLVLSIDAPDKNKMDKICGGYNFDILLDNLENLRKYPAIAGIVNSTLNEYNLQELPQLIEFAAKQRLLAVNFELPIGNEEFIVNHRIEIRKKIKEASEMAKKKGILLNPFYKITCNSRNSINPNILLSGEICPCCNGVNQNVRLGNVLKEDLEIVWNKKAVPLIQSEEFCKDCHLVRNLYKLLYK